MQKPRIGIRPIIDGRLAVRSGLEEKTMEMARRAANLISENVRYPDGTKAECVIADTTIGGGAEAAACAEKFGKENVTATLSVTPCWCYGSETMDMDPMTVKAIWGFNGTERPGAVYLAATLAAHAQKGLPSFSIYGKNVQDVADNSIPEDVKEKIIRFAQCAVAAGMMKNRSYLNLGTVSMGIVGSECNSDFLQKYLGIRAEYSDMSEISRRIKLGIYDPDEYKKALKWTKEHCREGFDKNAEAIRHTREQKDAEWEDVVKITLIIRDMMIGNKKLAEMGYYEESLGKNAIAGGFQGQRQWNDWLPNGDFSEAILNSSFYWNGIKEPMIVATENDYLNGLTMLFMHMLTGKASVFADVRTFWSPEAVKRVTGWQPAGLAQNGFIHLINSGAAALDGCGLQRDKDGNKVMKSWWDVNEKDAEACLNATDWCPADLGYFGGGGFSSHFKTDAEMPVTLVRLSLINGLGPILQIAEGSTCILPEAAHKTIDLRTDPSWPTTWFAPRLTGQGAFSSVYSVMANWGANHGAFTYGHIGSELITLASMLRIPVAMHNVERDRIFRPHSWASFGTADLESADYRACKAYGPLYR